MFGFFIVKQGAGYVTSVCFFGVCDGHGDGGTAGRCGNSGRGAGYFQGRGGKYTRLSGLFGDPREQFFKNKHGGEWSCASCHTDDPASQGKHAKSDKLIKPLAPSANPERFTEMKKVEKWYKRNCNDVLDRECTAQEKGDVLTYLLTIGK